MRNISTLVKTKTRITSDTEANNCILTRRFFLGALLFSLLPWGFAQAAPTSELKLWVVEASTEERDKSEYDKGLEAIQGILSSLPHNTYRKVRTGTHSLAEKGTTRIPATKVYTLEAASPVPTADGRQRVRLRILMPAKEKPAKEIQALSTDLLLRPDKQVLVRGLKLKDGTELIIVLSLSIPKEATVSS